MFPSYTDPWHKKIADAFLEKHGLRITFNFKESNFGRLLKRLLCLDSANVDSQPAVYPARLDLQAIVCQIPTAAATEVVTENLEDAWTNNEGDTSDEEEEMPADSTLRGRSALLTAACPREYPRDLAVRKAQKLMIPADFSTAEFLALVRRALGKHCTAKLLKASCHDEPHKRINVTTGLRERHKHVALLLSAPFAHKKVADAFQKETGIRVFFSFKLNRFVGNLLYLMEPGKKASTDLDRQPAVYPPTLDVDKELKSEKHPGDEPAKESRKRKRLSFDEVSNIVLEGIGEGPLRSADDLTAAAKSLKQKGNVELWNYLGALKDAAAVMGLVSKIWHMQGERVHHMWKARCPYKLEDFCIEGLSEVAAWREGKWKSHVLVLAGLGGYGKTNLAEALMAEVTPNGYWFVDDPDDFREVEGLVKADTGIVIDEICLAKFEPNDIKKLYDLEKNRRVHCRHLNASLPAGCPRILCTNSLSIEKFYPRMDPGDQSGVFRRHLFQTVQSDIRKLADVTEVLPTRRGSQSQSAQSVPLVAELQKLAQMFSDGLLDADEFKAAKTQLLQS